MRDGARLEGLDLVGLEPLGITAADTAEGHDPDQALLASGVVDGLEVNQGVACAARVCGLAAGNAFEGDHGHGGP
ncbi:hypothetical protein [Brachybacterium sp. GPGPB12]|uniref:hypothetical protein n=1 Tax=Brachybacterium sp. GPGPB12 TaxID=3023517 RepID=UPI00313462AE